MPDDSAPVKPATVIGISIEAKFNQSRSVVFQTHVPLDAPPEEQYRILNGLCAVLDRQEEFYLLKGLRITLERDEKQYLQQTEQLIALEDAYRREYDASGRRGDYKLQGQQKTNVDNQRTSLRALKDRIEQLKSQVAELENATKV